jgi:hypothetical protein
MHIAKNKIQKREKNKDLITVMKNSQQQHSNNHQRQHLDCKRGSSKATPIERKQLMHHALMIHEKDSEASLHALMKHPWQMIRACMTRSIPI